EPNRVPLVVDRPSHAVDPPEAQRLVHGLRPRDARRAGALLVVADQELLARVVVLLEPGAELVRRFEEGGLHRPLKVPGVSLEVSKGANAPNQEAPPSLARSLLVAHSSGTGFRCAARQSELALVIRTRQPNRGRQSLGRSEGDVHDDVLRPE